MRSPWAHIRQMFEHIAPRHATPLKRFAALEPLPKAHQFLKRPPVRDRKVESARNSLAGPGIAIVVRHVEVLVRCGITFVLAEEFQAWHAAHRTVEVGEFTGDLENECAFRNDCRRIVAKFTERVRVAQRPFQAFELRPEPFGLASRIS